MFDLFYTLFKYKEKQQQDVLGYYPEKVDVKAFPERRFLWASRFFVIFSSLSMCFTIILASTICILLPQRRNKIMPLLIDYERYQVTSMQESETHAYAGDLLTESVLAKYVIQRYTIGSNIEELYHRYSENNFLQLATDTEPFNEFMRTEYPYFEMLQKSGTRREVEITMTYPVSYDFWQVRFNTIDTIPNEAEPLISSWIATIRMQFNFSKYEDKNLGLINPFGMTVKTFDLSYMGNNRKSVRN